MPAPQTGLALVLKHLPNLTPKELSQVKARVGFLLGDADKGNQTQRLANDWLLEGLTCELRRRGLWLKNYPLPQLMFSSDYGVKATAVRTHLTEGAGSDKLTTVQLIALGALGVSALMDYLAKIRVPVGPKTVLNNLDKIPVALEESFPGYWASGMLRCCIER